MDGDGEGGLQLPQHVRGILHDLAVEVHHHALLVHRLDDPDVPVEHPHAGGGAVLLPPKDVVVVFHLHHPVPRPEDPVPEAALPLPLRGGIQGGLEGLVQHRGAGPPAAGGGEHLDLVCGDAHALRQPAAAQVHNGLHCQLGVPAAEEEEVAVVLPQVGQLTGIHHVGVADDGALGGLAEDLGEADHGHRPAANQVGEQVARPHRRQLVRVPHQYQAAVPPQGGEEGGHQGHVHHGDLVHNDRVHLQGVVLVVGESQLPRAGVEAGLQQPVDGGGVGGAQLPQALGRPAGGGGQGGVQPHGLKQGQHPPQAGGLAGARPAGEEHHLPGGGHLHRLALLGGVGDALLPLDAGDDPVQPVGGQQLRLAHLPDAVGDVGLRLVQGGDVHGVLAGDGLPVQFAPIGQGLQPLLQQVAGRFQQLPGGGDELLGGEEGVAVVPVVVGELKEQSGLQPLGVVRGDAQREGQGVRLGELHPKFHGGQDIGIGPHHLQGHVSVGPVQGAGQLRGELVLRQKFQQAAHPHLFSEGVADGTGPLGGDPFQGGELLRLLLDDPQGVLPEGFDELPGSCLADALDGSGGQVVEDLLQPLGQAALHYVGPELGAVGGVAHPLPPDSEVLPRGHPGHGAHYRHLLLPRVQAENRIAVFLVLKDDGGDGPLQGGLFLCELGHCGPLLSFVCSIFAWISPLFLSLPLGEKVARRSRDG